MADYLKPDAIRKMNHDDRSKSLRELRQELVHERGVAAMGGSPPSPGKIRQIRRQIARILTIQNEERIGVRGQTVKTPTSKGPAPGARTPVKGPPGMAAQRAHSARLARQPAPAPKPPRAKAPAKSPAAPAKAAANKAAKGTKNTPKKEEPRRNE